MSEFIRYTQDGSAISLQGSWTLDHFQDLTQALTKTDSPKSDITLDGGALKRIDTAGILALADFLKGKTRVSFANFSPERQEFIEQALELHRTEETEDIAEKPPFLWHSIESLGKATASGLEQTADFMAFLGQALVTLGRNLRNPRHFRMVSIVRHIHEAGMGAIPIVSLLAFLISIVLTYQAATQLKTFGADIFTVNLTVISILREMGVILTAIMVAGRSGSAYAAEIGVMKLREEIDALKTTGMDPFEVLVLPRIIALVIVMPLLTFIADIVGLIGTGIMSVLLLDISFGQYIERADYVMTLPMFMVGISKAPVFAFLIAIVGTWQGMRVQGSAESVGRLTTLAVVQSIFLVILADALFSIIFSVLGI